MSVLVNIMIKQTLSATEQRQFLKWRQSPIFFGIIFLLYNALQTGKEDVSGWEKLSRKEITISQRLLFLLGPVYKVSPWMESENLALDQLLNL